MIWAMQRAKKVTESNGRIVEYEYDDCYRLKEENNRSFAWQQVISYEYDKAGNRLKRTIMNNYRL